MKTTQIPVTFDIWNTHYIIEDYNDHIVISVPCRKYQNDNSWCLSSYKETVTNEKTMEMRSNKMYYYVSNTSNGINLIVLNEKDAINEFSEKTTTPKGIDNKNFYDPKTRYIYTYYAGGQCLPTTKCEYTEEEANALLLELALDNAEQNNNGSILFKPRQNPKELIADIEQYIENLEEDNPDDSVIPTLKGIIKTLSIEEHIKP